MPLMTDREYQTHHMDLVLKNEYWVYHSIMEMVDEIKKETDNQEEIVPILASRIKEWIEDEVMTELDRLQGIGGQIVRELLDMSMVDWEDITRGFLD